MRKILNYFVFILLIVNVVALSSCKKHYCDYCGAEASWQATETFAGQPFGDDPHTYVCVDCKRIGRGPIPFSGNSISWKRI